MFYFTEKSFYGLGYLLAFQIRSAKVMYVDMFIASMPYMHACTYAVCLIVVGHFSQSYVLEFLVLNDLQIFLH